MVADAAEDVGEIGLRIEAGVPCGSMTLMAQGPPDGPLRTSRPRTAAPERVVHRPRSAGTAHGRVPAGGVADG